jgi:hypothetical protein
LSGDRRREWQHRRPKPDCGASTTEEPGAGKPHAGICAGCVRQLTALPRWRAGGRKVSGSARAAPGSSVGRRTAAAICLQWRLDLVTRNESDFAHSSVSDQPLDAIEPLQAYCVPCPDLWHSNVVGIWAPTSYPCPLDAILFRQRGAGDLCGWKISLEANSGNS